LNVRRGPGVLLREHLQQITPAQGFTVKDIKANFTVRLFSSCIS